MLVQFLEILIESDFEDEIQFKWGNTKFQVYISFMYLAFTDLYMKFWLATTWWVKALRRGLTR